MSDSDESFDISRDSKPYTFEQCAKKVTASIIYEVAAASADVYLEQPPVQPTPSLGPQQDLD